jgi:hypothetical protein
MMAGIKHPARTGRATCSPRQFYWGLSRDPMAETNGSNSRTGAEKGKAFRAWAKSFPGTSHVLSREP